MVEGKAGGQRGGGARLTPLGRDLVGHFRAAEAAAAEAARTHLAALEIELARPAVPAEPIEPQAS